MKHCPNCNYENAQTSMYCENCGALLPTVANSSQSEPTYARTYDPSYANFEAPSITTQEQSYYSDPVAPPPPPPDGQNIYRQRADVPPPPPSFPSYPSVPAPSYSYGFPASDVGASQPRKRSFGSALLSSILYLLGAFCFVFGIAGFLLYGQADTLVGGIFIVLSIVALIVLIPLLIIRKQPILRGWVRVLIVFGLAVLGTLALIAIAALSHNGTSYTGFGIVFIICGFAIAAVSFW